MAELDLYSMEKKAVGKVPFPEKDFGRIRPDLVHQVVVAQRAHQRQGTSRVKTRHEVTGSTRKIYRQKGTGRARHGDIKAPIFVGGGRAFGPKPRSWRTGLTREARKGALRSVLAQRGQEKKLWVIDELKFQKPNTKEAVRFFAQFQIASALVVVEGTNEGVERSVRNIPRFKVCRVDAVSVLDMVHYEHLIMTRAAYEKVLQGVA